MIALYELAERERAADLYDLLSIMRVSQAAEGRHVEQMMVRLRERSEGLF